MTLRERIETVFHGGAPDAMVWFGDLTYWYSSHQQIGDLPERWRGDRGIGQLHRDYNVGEYIPGCCACDTIEGDKVRVESCEADGKMTIQWHTPAGVLTERREYSIPSFSWGITEHAVKTVEDLRTVRYIMENRRYVPCPDKIETVDRDCAEFGLPVVAVPGTPITELNKTWIGVMDLAYLIADETAEVEKTLDAIAESHERLLRLAGECACGYVMVCENLSGETMGGYFDRYMRDCLTRRTDSLHRHGKKVMIHIDGTQYGVLDKIASTGIDCVDALTPKPVGDISLKDIRNVAGPDIIILGGIPGAMFAPPFTAADMEKHVKEIIRLHKNSGKFMLGVADQVPPDGDIKLVNLVSDLVEEYGHY